MNENKEDDFWVGIITILIFILAIYGSYKYGYNTGYDYGEMRQRIECSEKDKKQ